jgi:hypothetical protein
MVNDNLAQTTVEPDVEMRQVLDELLARDEDIAARAVARLHPSINAASSITRSSERSRLLLQYQERQAEFRRWRGRPNKLSGAAAANALAERDVRITELESQVALLTASHLAMIRAVGEMGGFSRWAQFFDSFRTSRDHLIQFGTLPETKIESFNQQKTKK